ncbi:YhcN/YlaJ family sporulation lipoprotein [Bacillus salitolerans]|uniref:YhcN/YlaJ family sporulation lipoprotein n=1 Tax=Bacillus salitolerans TaxID=1437434 RepID=A0ABW4LKN2_9BACI
MKRNRSWLLFVILCFVVGCNNNEATNNEGNDNLVQVKNQAPTTTEQRSAREVAEHLVDLATSVENVNDATALVVGKVAVVGIDVNSEIDRSRVGTIKYTVAESLKHDPLGANAIVIADPDANVRLREMGREIQQGRPIAGIMDELSAIVGRLMPELPADIFQDSTKRPTDVNDKQLSENQDQQLDKEQDDQSKGKMNNRSNPKVPTNQ